jgi:dethiobiotin synthetase
MRIVVVGTGTEVGKTHVSACLLALARAKGRRVAAYKPIATGMDGVCEDAAHHADALAAAYRPPTFAYKKAVSPHLAAREEGRPIELDVIRRHADQIGLASDFVLIEAAGGLFTPLSETETNVTLVRGLLPAFVVLVAPDRLGALHDVGASLVAARASGIEIGGVVLSAPSTPDDSTGSNASELDLVGLGPILAVFPRASVDARASHDAAARVWEAILGPL